MGEVSFVLMAELLLWETQENLGNVKMEQEEEDSG